MFSPVVSRQKTLQKVPTKAAHGLWFRVPLRGVGFRVQGLASFEECRGNLSSGAFEGLLLLIRVPFLGSSYGPHSGFYEVFRPGFLKTFTGSCKAFFKEVLGARRALPNM